MAKFCPECGKELEENSLVCKNCGKKIEANAQTNNINQTIINNPKQANGFAIAGFVLSLISLLCCGTTSVLGLVFSIIGLVNANKQNGEGKGLAIAGIVISSIMIILFICLYGLGVFASMVDSSSPYSSIDTGVYY